jgi:Leucine-rich repeat (LRR) protein
MHCSNLIWAEQTLPLTTLEYATVETSLENRCRLFFLTELKIAAKSSNTRSDNFKILHNLSSLTNLQLLHISVPIITLPVDMACRCMHLQQLEIYSYMLEHLPNSFTRCGAFPALITLKLLCHKLVEFPKVDEGALPKLRTMQINSNSLQTLPLSLELLPNLRNLTIYNAIDKLENSCREN